MSGSLGTDFHMAAASRLWVLGKRVRQGPAEQQELAEPRRASKRLRAKREADACRNSQALSTAPTRNGQASSTATIRNGLATPEPSSLTESQTSLPADDTPLERKGIFPFMQLPAELRIHIYHMCLHRDEPLLLHAPRASDKDPEGGSTTLNDSSPSVFTSVIAAINRRPPPAIAPFLDPVVPAILRLNQQIHKESRAVLYNTNTFTLSLTSGIHTLSTLHQRSRSLIKHVILTIPSHHDILDSFADLVRLGLRYCWGLKTFKIILLATLPDDGRTTHATSVYANAFHILRWLPRGCKVVLEGNVSEVVRDVVQEEGRLQNVLDEMGYAKRQHQMPERH